MSGREGDVRRPHRRMGMGAGGPCRLWRGTWTGMAPAGAWTCWAREATRWWVAASEAEVKTPPPPAFPNPTLETATTGAGPATVSDSDTTVARAAPRVWRK